MNPATSTEALTLLRAYKQLTVPKNVQIISLVPYPFVPFVRQILGPRSVFGLQNVYQEKSGAHTGEVGIGMVVDQKPTYVLVGHSERRLQGETDATINQKLTLILKAKLTPILCVGERDRDDHGFFLKTIEKQIKIALFNISKNTLANIVIAYEPVWAIGKGATREATPEECHEMVIYIKKVLSDMYGGKIKHMPRIIYGGSVSPENGLLFITQGGVDGLLPGRLSLEPKKLQKLLNSFV